MKKFTKVFTILAALILVLNLAACSVKEITDKTEALAYLDEADSKMNDLTAYTVTMSGQVVEMGMTVTMTGSMKIKNEEFVFSGSSGASGITMEINMCYKDGYLYSSVLGQKVKTKVSVEDAMKEAFGSTDADSVKISDTYKGDDFVFEGKVEDGENVFSFTKGTRKDVFKIDSKKRITYMETDGMKMTMDFKTPELTFPSDLDTYKSA